MNEQTIPSSPASSTPDQTVAKPRERGLDRIDVRPVLHRLDGMVGKPWTDVSAKIDALNGMRRPEIRSAYLRCVGEHVATSEDVLPNAKFYVDDLGRLAARERAKVADDKAADTTPFSEETENFLGYRVVGIRGGTLFWFNPIQRTRKAFVKTCPQTGKPAYRNEREVAFRQGRPLTPEETATFNDLDRAVRDAILAMAPAFSPSPAN